MTNYRCHITVYGKRAIKNGTAKLNLTVVQAPIAVRIAGGSEIVLNLPQDKTIEVSLGLEVSKLQFAHHYLAQVICLVEGGWPLPTFSWFLEDEYGELEAVGGGRAISCTKSRGEGVNCTWARDPTRSWQLRLSNSLNSELATLGLELGFNHFQVITYTTKLKDHGKNLVCIVNHAGFGEEALAQRFHRAQVRLDIRARQVHTELHTELHTEFHSHTWFMKVGEPYDILVTFYSHPEPTELYWEMHDGTIVGRGAFNQLWYANQRYTTHRLVPGPHDGQFTVKLTIENVAESDDETKNKLVVGNYLGVTTYEIAFRVLKESDATGSDSGSGSLYETTTLQGLADH